MRKNSVRKWLHAILDLLPLFVIPIFAIYTRNENYNSNIEIEVEQKQVIHFNQHLDDISLNINNDTNYFYSTFTALTDIRANDIIYIKYYQNVDFTADTRNTLMLYYLDGQTQRFIKQSEATNRNLTEGWYDWYTTCQYPYTRLAFWLQGALPIQSIQFTQFQCFNLTKMYGAGNEPTKQEFNSTFTNDYYGYVADETQVIDNGSITYNDTDVGSQFVYTLYNATDKYFNCTNLFNLEQVWNWVQLNLFSGNAPLMVYVVWQVIVYEFFMDLIFLLYSVFMFIIDFAENCLERPFDKIRRL